jgi:cytoskeletal protein CcmA (bactofilin family)
MFFKKKKKKLEVINTLIDRDNVIRGNYSYSGGLRLDGKIYGDLTVEEDSGGTLIMGEESRIRGNVIVETAIIAGEIHGDVKCYGYLELQPGSAIEGDIEYNLIEIHAGARVNGHLKQITKAQIDKVQKKLPFKKDKKDKKVEIIGDKNDN